MMFYDIPMVNLSDAEMLDKARVRELVEYERYCRDYSDYGTKQAERRLCLLAVLFSHIGVKKFG